MCRAQVATFCPTVLLDDEAPPGFMQKARAGETTFGEDSAVGGLLLKSKQASPGEVPDSCELKQHPDLLTGGRLGRLTVFLVSHGSRAMVPPASVQGAVQTALVSLRVFGKPSALMESGREMYDSKNDFWEQGAMFLLGKSCSHHLAEAGARRRRHHCCFGSTLLLGPGRGWGGAIQGVK